jgi:hypothetical protein
VNKFQIARLTKQKIKVFLFLFFFVFCFAKFNLQKRYCYLFHTILESALADCHLNGGKSAQPGIALADFSGKENNICKTGGCSPNCI